MKLDSAIRKKLLESLFRSGICMFAFGTNLRGRQNPGSKAWRITCPRFAFMAAAVVFAESDGFVFREQVVRINGRSGA